MLPRWTPPFWEGQFTQDRKETPKSDRGSYGNDEYSGNRRGCLETFLLFYLFCSSLLLLLHNNTCNIINKHTTPACIKHNLTRKCYSVVFSLGVGESPAKYGFYDMEGLPDIFFLYTFYLQCTPSHPEPHNHCLFAGSIRGVTRGG